VSARRAGAVVTDAGAALPAQERDLAVPERDQMLHCRVGSGGAVHIDPVADLPLRPHPAEGHERHAPLGQPGLARVAPLVGVTEHEGVDVVLVAEFFVALQARAAGR
jgi:hypothetical protein